MTENARPGSWWGSIAWAWRTPGKSDALKMMHFVLKIIHDVLKMMHFVSKMMHFIFKMMNLVVQLQNIPGNHVVPGLRVHVSHLNPPFLVFQSHLARPLQRWTFAFEPSFLTQCDLGRVFWIQNSSFICKKMIHFKTQIATKGRLVREDQPDGRFVHFQSKNQNFPIESQGKIALDGCAGLLARRGVHTRGSWYNVICGVHITSDAPARVLNIILNIIWMHNSSFWIQNAACLMQSQLSEIDYQKLTPQIDPANWLPKVAPGASPCVPVRT